MSSLDRPASLHFLSLCCRVRFIIIIISFNDHHDDDSHDNEVVVFNFASALNLPYSIISNTTMLRMRKSICKIETFYSHTHTLTILQIHRLIVKWYAIVALTVHSFIRFLFYLFLFQRRSERTQKINFSP